jgi:hypothetical protein
MFPIFPKIATANFPRRPARVHSPANPLTGHFSIRQTKEKTPPG